MTPLAERMRPLSLDNYIGQRHLVGPDAPLRRMIEQQHLSSMILWGPPGVGKTTLARIMARSLSAPFFTLSAVSSGVKEVRDVIEKARKSLSTFNSQLSTADSPRPSAILFIDEIHRFSKSQQDSLLGAVEQGIVTLIGATTENPSFEVIRPLLSRCQVYVLQPLNKDDLLQLAQHAITTDATLRQLNIQIKEYGALLRYSGGDARKLLNILELVTFSLSTLTSSTPLPLDNVGAGRVPARNNCPRSTAAFNSQLSTDNVIITDAAVEKSLSTFNFDLRSTPPSLSTFNFQLSTDTDLHYDIISAFIKSIRGSDPDAALYWLARMIEGGEDPKFIARRLIISASEDIGLANPNALLLANAAFDAVDKIGWPEARIPLAEATVYLATSDKSNSAYLAIGQALSTVRDTGNLPVPLHLRNAPTQLMAELGYSDGYKYPHDFPGHFTPQQYLPDQIKDTQLWHPQHSPAEERLAQRHKDKWGRE